jgi:hypothetical protein
MNIIVLTLSLLSAPAYAADPVIDCILVRQYVAEHGRTKALAWAIREGYSWRQIRVAKQCLK